MGFRIGRQYIKMKCPLCWSIYLLNSSDINQVKLEKKFEPDPDDPDDDGTRYHWYFYCEDCNRVVRGIKLGREIATDAYIEDCVNQMKTLK